MASLSGPMAKLKLLSAKPYIGQAQWFLNAYWADNAPAINFGSNPVECEKVWEYTQSMIEIDAKGKDGCELDEFKAHRFLEKNTEAITVKKMREALAEIDVDFNKSVSLTEFLVYHYKVDYKYLVGAPQAADPESQAKIDAAQAALEAAKVALDAAKEAAATAAADEEAARAAEAKAVEAEEAQKKAEDEVKKVLAEIEAQESALTAKKDKLRATGEDESLGQVKRNRAKMELAALEGQDPLPLARAKINQGAAVRKAARATKAAAKAVAAAKDAREAAEASKLAADEAVEAAAEALENADRNFEEVKTNCTGSGQGQIWWIGRELEEAKKYMSQKQLAKLAAKEAASA